MFGTTTHNLLACLLAAPGLLFNEQFETAPIGRILPGATWSTAESFFTTDLAPLGQMQSGIHASRGTGVPGVVVSTVPFGPQAGSFGTFARVIGAGTVYQFEFVDTGNGHLITRVAYETDGRITVGQENPDPDCDGLVMVDSGLTWTSGDFTNACITVMENGELAVLLGNSPWPDTAIIGRSAALVAFEEGDAATPPGGIGQFRVVSDDAGVGDVEDFGDADPLNDIALGTGDNIMIDAVTFVADTQGLWCQGIARGGGCQGDANGDGRVDIDDIVSVVLDFGLNCLGNACPNGGDVNFNGTVDVDDIVWVVLNFGNVCIIETFIYNESCADRQTLHFPGTTEFDSGQILDTWQASGIPCTGADPTTDRWYALDMRCDGTVTIDTIGSDYNTILEVYSTSSCTTLATDLVACDDDGALASSDPDPLHPANFDSRVTLSAVTGERLVIRIIGSSAPAPALGAGDGVLNIAIACDDGDPCP